MSNDRCNRMFTKIDNLHSVLLETGDLERPLFTVHQRSKVVDELVDVTDNYMNSQAYRDLLTSGCKGFLNMTDLELINEVLSSYCPDRCADEDFDGFGVYPIIESAVNEELDRVLNSIIEPKIL